MKFFIDTANIDQIREAASTGIIDGVTTNPSLLAREEGSYRDILKEICSIVSGPVSAEVTALDAEGPAVKQRLDECEHKQQHASDPEIKRVERHQAFGEIEDKFEMDVSSVKKP